MIPFTTFPPTWFDLLLIFLLYCAIVPLWQKARQRWREREREREERERQMGLRK